MKKTTKTSAPASYKSTNKSGLRQVLEPIKSYLSELSRENNIRLSGLTVTGDTIREAWECGCEELKDFAEYIRKDRDAVEQAYLTNYSNAIMEGNVNRAKAIKRSMYNRADTQALRAKMIFAGRNEALKYHLN